MSSEYKDIRDNAKDSKSSQLIHDIGLVNNQNKKMPCSAYMWNMAFFLFANANGVSIMDTP